ncbi:unnamed protein product [Nippostrongylus brasiliensis]|uniref:DNA-directed RNA polymerase n=1 Tax=Nippostrongylus brasiliensis TaxID=27835 RepID=A0A0N4Y2D8_NIPBR|nr:unnamed protein product [Nippostrongylus brasiliensis]
MVCGDITSGIVSPDTHEKSYDECITSDGLRSVQRLVYTDQLAINQNGNSKNGSVMGMECGYVSILTLAGDAIQIIDVLKLCSVGLPEVLLIPLITCP